MGGMNNKGGGRAPKGKDSLSAGSELDTTDSKRPTAAAAEAQRILAEDAGAAGGVPGAGAGVASLVMQLFAPKESSALTAARVVEEIANQRPDALAAHIEKLIQALQAPIPRVAQAAGAALTPLGRVAPAKVAKHLDTLQNLVGTNAIATDGIVRTFTNLCIASVAYQKRLEASFVNAMNAADEKTLQRWSELVLPALKGEPHAEVRAAIEKRLPTIARPVAQKIAEQLGIKLRPIPK